MEAAEHRKHQNHKPTNFNSMPFIPVDYDQSQIAGSKQDFLKLSDGETKIRILSPELCFGYEYWTTEKKPKRVKNRPAVTPADIRLDEESGKPEPVRHIWAMQIWDYSDSKVKIWSFHQASFMTPLASFFNDEDWGDPIDYDLKITKKGSGLNTKYTIVPSPKKPLTAEQVDAVENQVATFDLNSLFAEPDQLPQQLQAPQTQGFSETSGTASEAKQWAVKQGLEPEMADNLLSDIDAIASERKEAGTSMTGNERRQMFISSVKAANPDIKPFADEIPF